MPMFNGWLQSTNRLQTEFGHAPVTEGIEYLRTNVLAATDELHEVLREAPWKPWKRYPPLNKDAIRARIIDECVDVLHFVANILCWVGATDEEVSTAYLAKTDVNARRQIDGY